jgi:hypothetical protein
MPKKCYIPKSFRGAAAERITQANEIIDNYSAQGLTLTLRQLYYRLVASDTIPNNFRSYKNLQRIVNDARLAGLIDWHAIEDRTRNLDSPSSWEGPEAVIDAAAWSYRRNLWKDQPYYVEVWVEKDALLGVIQKACREHRLPFFSCRGYTSQSEVWSAAMRLGAKDRECVVLHLGDHDPSGVDMTRDIQDRFRLFGATNTEVRRLALNMDQIRELNPPPNPTKISDSRTSGYEAQFGQSSWELDALEPNYIIDLVHRETLTLIDRNRWEERLKLELAERGTLSDISKRYDEVVGHLEQTRNDNE